MVRNLLFLMTTLLFALPFNTIAQQVESTPQQIASHFPADVDLFTAFEVNPDFIDELDLLFSRISGELPDDVIETQTLRTFIDTSFSPSESISVAGLIESFIGEYVGISVSNSATLLDDDPDNDAGITQIVIETTRSQAAEAVLRLVELVERSDETQGDFKLFPIASDDFTGRVALSDELLIITLGSEALPLNLDSTLADNPDFLNTIGELPADTYNLVAYANTPPIVQDTLEDDLLQELLSALGLNVDRLQPTAAGINLAGNEDITIDLAQRRAANAESIQHAVDIAFLENVPASTPFIVHTTNLDSFIRTASGVIASISASDTAELVYNRLESIVSLLLELDLQNDILSWLSDSDYALILDTDVDILDAWLDEPEGTVPLEFAIVFEANEPQQAARLSNAIAGSAVRVFGAAQDDVAIIPNDSDADVQTRLVITVQDAILGQLDIAVGNTNDIFYIGLDETINTLLETTAATSIVSTPLFSQTVDQGLASPTLQIYASDSGVAELVDIGLVLTDPVFENIRTTNEAAQDLITAPEAEQLTDLATVLMANPQALTNNVASTAITGVVSSTDSLLLRWVIRLRPLP